MINVHFFCRYDGNIFMFMEGKINGYLQNIWLKLMRLTPQQGKVFFNDENIYEKRLYDGT